jgi:hypothetical protein
MHMPPTGASTHDLTNVHTCTSREAPRARVGAYARVRGTPGMGVGMSVYEDTETAADYASARATLTIDNSTPTMPRPRSMDPTLERFSLPLSCFFFFATVPLAPPPSPSPTAPPSAPWPSSRQARALKAQQRGSSSSISFVSGIRPFRRRSIPAFVALSRQPGKATAASTSIVSVSSRGARL